MTTKLLLIVSLILLPLVTVTRSPSSGDPSQGDPASVDLYGVYEQSFAQAGKYNNPYTEVSATASLRSPTNARFEVPLFWDGGTTWKLRFSPDKVGPWQWSIASNDAGLDGKTGSFNAVPSQQKGGIQAMLAAPHHFQYQNGEPFYWLGDTQWSLFTDNNGESHNRSAVQKYIDVRSSQGINVVHSMLMSAVKWDNSGGAPFTDFSREKINPAYWQEVDTRLAYLNQKGITGGLLLAWAEDSGYDWASFKSEAARLRYAQYVAARYSAYNVYFIVSGEYDEYADKGLYNKIGSEIAASDPHERLISIHPQVPSVRDFADQPWMGFGDYQQNYKNLHTEILKSRGKDKPVVNSEYAYYLRDQDGDGEVDKKNSSTVEEIRHATWDIAMGGGYFITGFGTTYFGGNRDPGKFNVDASQNDIWEEQVQHVKKLFTGLNWWQLEPADELYTGGGTGYVLANPGEQYVLYVRGAGGTSTLDLGNGVQDSFNVFRFDPRTGSYTTLSEVSGNRVTLDVPDSQDWVFVLENTQSASVELHFTEVWGGLPQEQGGHGVMWGDLDGDGGAELYLPLNHDNQGPKQDLLIAYLEGGSFREDGEALGVSDTDDGGSHGAVWADLDNDGDYDLVNGATYQKDLTEGEFNNIFRNEEGVFIESTPAVMKDQRNATRAVLALDLDADDDLDIFTVSGSLGSDDPRDETNEIYINQGNFQFTALTSGALATAAAGQGATDTDFDGDGDIDIIAANRTGEVNILRNDGAGNFEPVSPASIGIDQPAGDGITSADTNNDGYLDLLLSSDDRAFLFINNGNGTFSAKQSFSGIDGYMGGFADLDQDGDLDLVFAGGKHVYLNDGRGEFTEGPAIPTAGIDDPRSIAFADFDDDGDLDFAVGAKKSRNYIVRNDFDKGNWLKVRLVSPAGQAGAFGAKVYVFPDGQINGKLIGMREAKSNYGYLAQDDPVMHFGLGDFEKVDLAVHFLDGTEFYKYGLAQGQTIIIDGGSDSDPPPTVKAPEPAAMEIEPEEPVDSGRNNSDPIGWKVIVWLRDLLRFLSPGR